MPDLDRLPFAARLDRMNDAAVMRYFQSVLRPQLRSLRLSSLQEHLIVADIESRVRSLLANWSDSRFRKAALLPALEVAQAYKPDAPLEIRALVAATIRNSMLTELNAQLASHPKLGDVAGRLSDENVRVVTGSAISHFTREWQEKPNVSVGDTDLFRNLAERFPAAWKRIEAIANSKKQEVKLQEELVPSPAFEESTEQPKERSVVESGYALELNPTETALLTAVKKDPQAFFFVPVFKMLTRNPEKLLKVICLLLSWRRSFATCNYFISNAHCARRTCLLPAPHDIDDICRMIPNAKGLIPAHVALLRQVSI